MIKFDGYFINLDRSGDRLASIRKQLEALGCLDLLQRFPAVDGLTDGPFESRGDNSVWACRRSHELAILQSDPDSVTLILEDDVELSREFPQVINAGVIDNMVKTYPDLDMFFLECAPFIGQVPFLIKEAEKNMRNRSTPGIARPDRHLMNGVSFLSAQGIYAFCAAAYGVTPKGKATLRRIFEFLSDKQCPIDMVYHNYIASGTLNAHITVPFIATPRHMAISTIAYDDVDPSKLPSKRDGFMISAIRRMLFAGDPDIDLVETEALLDERDESDEYRLTMRIFRSMTSHRG